MKDTVSTQLASCQAEMPHLESVFIASTAPDTKDDKFISQINEENTAPLNLKSASLVDFSDFIYHAE